MVTFEGVLSGHVVESEGRRRYRSAGNCIPFGTVVDEGIFIKGRFCPVSHPLGYIEGSTELVERVKALEAFNTVLQTELSCINERLNNLKDTSVSWSHLRCDFNSEKRSESILDSV